MVIVCMAVALQNTQIFVLYFMGVLGACRIENTVVSAVLVSRDL
jgi:hypothetical protein